MIFRIPRTALLWGLAMSFAQQPLQIIDTIATQNLDEVVIADSRMPLKRSQSGRIVERISSKEIEKFQGQDLAELLRSRSGIDILGSRSQLGQNLTTSIRGGRNNQVLILVDGVRVNDPSRPSADFDLNFLPLASIASIEILKGAAGTLYGSSAATGVIRITTHKGSREGNLTVGSNFGTLLSQNERDGGITLVDNTISYTRTFGQTDVNAFYSQRYSDGMSAALGGNPDLFSRNNIGIAIGHRFTDSYTARLSANFDDVKSEYDGFDATTFLPADADNRLLSKQLRFVLNQNFQYQHGELQLDMGYQETERDFESNFPLSYESTNFTADLSNRYIFSEKWYTIVGYFIQRSTAVIDQGEESTQNDIYANVVYTRGGFNFNVGTRWNNHDVYGAHWTYNINPSYNLRISEQRALKVFTSLGTGFLTPSLNQLYSPNYGNTALEPEVSQSFEIGTAYDFQLGELSVAYFTREETPTLIFNNDTYRYDNSAEKATYSGAEFRYLNQLSRGLFLRANYTFTETEGGDLRRIPKHAYRVGLDVELTNDWSLATDFSRTGARLAANNTDLEAYSLWDLRLQYEWQKANMMVFTSVTNVLNTDYIEFLNYSSRGRNITAGFRWTP